MRREMLAQIERRAIEAVSRHASVAAAILDAWSSAASESIQSVHTLTALAGLGVTEEMSASIVLAELSKLDLLENLPVGYRPNCSRDAMKRLAVALYAVSYYASSVHVDATFARVVVTKPPQPSVLESQLAARGWLSSDLEDTRHAFHDIVRGACRRVVIMTPFLDQRGALWIRELLESVPEGVEKTVILRSLESPSRHDYPSGYGIISDWLRAAEVRVFNYSIPKGTKRETFHAKVIVCDEEVAYVGSSNFTAASFDHSMELGVTLFGHAARKVALIVDAVLASAKKWE